MKIFKKIKSVFDATQLKSRKICKVIIPVLLCVFGLGFLFDTEYDYLLCVYLAIAFVVCLIVNNCLFNRINLDRHQKIGLGLFSTILSLFVTVTNYKIFTHFVVLQNLVFRGFLIILLFIFVTFCGAILFRTIIKTLYCVSLNKYKSKSLLKISDNKFFGVIFISLLILYGFFYFFVSFPGVYYNDTFLVLLQNIIVHFKINTGQPVFYTLILTFGYCLLFGMKTHNIFYVDDLNFGNVYAAVYLIIQIVIIAAVFAFSIYTLKQIKAPKILIFLLLGFYIVNPLIYNYVSVFVKDVTSSIFLLLFLILLIRYLYKLIKYKKLSIFLMFLSICIFTLVRVNGIICLLICAILLVVCLFKEKNIFPLKCVVVISTVVCLAFVAITDYVVKIDLHEVFNPYSIPIQQIAYIVSTDGQLDDNDKEIIENIMPIEEIKNNYDYSHVDPIKFNISYSSCYYAITNKQKLLWLYTHVGLNNPKEYLIAYIKHMHTYFNSMDKDEQKRYGGLIFIDNYDSIVNEFHLCERDNGLHKLNYKLTHKIGFFDFHCISTLYEIGLISGLMISTLCVCILKKNKYLILVLSFIISIGLCMVMFCPVPNDFRYIYTIYIPLPFLLFFILSEYNFMNKKKNVKPK